MRKSFVSILLLLSCAVIMARTSKVTWQPVTSLADLQVGDSVVFAQADGNGGGHEYAVNQQATTSSFLMDVSYNLFDTKDQDGYITPSANSRFCVYQLTAANGDVYQIQFSYRSLFKNNTRYLSIAPSTTSGSSYTPTYTGTYGISQGDYPQDLYLQQLDENGHFYAYKLSGSTKYYAGYTDFFTVMHAGRYTTAYNQHAQKKNLSEYTSKTQMACAWNMYKRYIYYLCRIQLVTGDKASCAYTDTTCYFIDALPNVTMIDTNFNMVGWYDGKDTLAVGSYLHPQDDMVLTALYDTAQTHFDLGEHCIWMDNSDTIQTIYGRTITLPKAKGRTGYHFLGWSSIPNQTSESAVDIGLADASYVITTNTTFYAVYQEAESVSDFWIADQTNPLQNGDEVRLVMENGIYQNEGFVLMASTTAAMSNGTVSLARNYPTEIPSLPNSYTFKTSNPNGGTLTDFYGNFLYNNSSAGTSPTLYISGGTSSTYRQGYKFVTVDNEGHYTIVNMQDENYQYLCYVDKQTIHIASSDYSCINQFSTEQLLVDARKQNVYPNVWTVYRKTKLFKYKIKLLPGEGIGEPITLEGYEVTLPVTNTYTTENGLSVVGWVNGDDTIPAGTTIHPIEDVSYTAIYGFPILHFEMGIHSSTQIPNLPFEQMNLPWVNGEDGWRFLGWSESKDATTPDYNPYELYPPEGNGTENKTLYAVYEQKEPCYLFTEVHDVNDIHDGDDIVLVMSDANPGGTHHIVPYLKIDEGTLGFDNWDELHPQDYWIFHLNSARLIKNRYFFSQDINGKTYSFYVDSYRHWVTSREGTAVGVIEPDGYDYFRINMGDYLCYDTALNDRLCLVKDGELKRYAISQYADGLSLQQACEVLYSKPAAWRIFITQKFYKERVFCYSHGPRITLMGPYAILPDSADVVTNEGYRFLFWRDEENNVYNGGDTLRVTKDIRVEAVYLAPGEELPKPDPVIHVQGDGMDGLGYDPFGHCALNGDTAYKYMRTHVDEPIDIPLEFAYGWHDGFVPEYIQVVDSPVIGKVVVDSVMQSVRFTPYKGFIGVDGFLIRMLDHQHLEQLLYIDVESCNAYLEDGHEFIFSMLRGAFPSEVRGCTGSQYYVRTLANLPTRIELITFNGDTIVTDIKPHDYYEVQLSSQCATGNKANYIRSSAPIAVETMEYEPYSVDGTSQLPLNRLGTDYILQAAQWSETLPNLFAIVGTEDSTVIAITPATPLKGHPAYATYEVKLQRGEVYRCESLQPGYGYSMSGTTIHANHPVAVYQGNVCTLLIPPVGGNWGAMDHMEEQAHPLERAAGTEFVVPGTVALTEDYVEFVALEDNTDVTIGTKHYHCNALDTVWSIVKMQEVLYVTSTKPIIGQYFICGGEHDDGILGDPDQFYLHPTKDLKTMTTFSCHRVTYDSQIHCNRVTVLNIVATPEARNSIYLDGELLTDFQKVMYSGSKYYYKQMEIPSYLRNRVHTLASRDSGFVAYTYGMFQAESYSYSLPLMHSHKKLTRETKYDTICHGDSYSWQGKSLMKAGFYTDTVREELLIREVHNLYLHVEDSSFIDTTVLVCQDSLPYLWRGHSLMNDTIAIDTVANDHGCDSIYQLTLQTHRCDCEAKSYTDTIVEYDSLPFVWFEKEYYDYGFYRDTLIGAGVDGCDSIGELYLLYHRLYEDSVNVCNDAQVTFETPFGSYDVGDCDEYCGCILMTDDSVCLVEICLTVNRHDSITIMPAETVYIFDGEEYSWRGNVYIDPGLYQYRHGDSHYGCDTIDQLNLIVLYPHVSEEYCETCDNQPFTWHGREYTQSGTYIDSLKAVHGEDSTCILHLTVHSTYMQSPYGAGPIPSEPGPDNDPDPGWWDNPGIMEGIIPADTVCGTQFVWHGHVLTENGEYFDTIPSSHGCDSLVWINLVLMNCCDSTPVVTDTTIAYGSSIEWFGNTYSQSGIYNDTLPGEPCDSIGQLILHVTYSDTVYTCDNGSVTFVTPFGNWESRECDTLTGCLSAAPDGTCLVEGSLYVVRLLADSIAEDTTVCEGAIVSWHGQSLLGEGTFYDTIPYRTQSTCDSLYCQITIHRTSAVETQIADTVCFGADYEWHGQTVTDITEDRVLKDVLSTTYGCDSVVVLTVHPEDPPITIMTNATICAGTTYTWHTYRDQTFSTQGMYEDTLWTERGCFSQTYALSLLVTTCACDTAHTHTYKQLEEDELPYEWNGHVLPQLPVNETRDTVFVFPTRRLDNSCDSISNMHIHVLEPCEIKSIYLPEYWNEEKK